MNYYPLPKDVAAAASTWLAQQGPANVIDPCAGEGDALLTLTSGINVNYYGIEIHDKRFEALEKRLPSGSKTLHGSIHHCRVGMNTMQMVYCNPPYEFEQDSSGASQRSEQTFLNHTLQWLCKNGILVFVIPIQSYKRTNMIETLVTHFKDIQVRKFTYKNEKDTHVRDDLIIFAKRRAVKKTPKAIEIVSMRDGAEYIKWLEAKDEPEYRLPAALHVPTFKKVYYSDEELAASASKHGVRSSKAYADLFAPSSLKFRPIMPMRQGHVASIIAAGGIDNLVVQTDKGYAIVKGASYKQLSEPNVSITENEREQTIKIQKYETPKSQITILDESGEIQTYRESELTDFITDNTALIADAIRTRYEPIYSILNHVDDANGYRVELMRAFPNKFVPGTTWRGLMPPQMHTAAAVVTALTGKNGYGKSVCKPKQSIFLQGEMGTGYRLCEPIRFPCQPQRKSGIVWVRSNGITSKDTEAYAAQRAANRYWAEMAVLKQRADLQHSSAVVSMRFESSHLMAIGVTM